MQRFDIVARYFWQFGLGRKIDHNVPEDWLPALATLCAAVDELFGKDDRENFYWRDIKEKHGQLAVDYTAPAELTDALEALVNAAETTCREVSPHGLAKASDI